MSWFVLSIGGSIIVPDGIDTTYLKKLRTIFTPLLKKHKFALVIGGGKTARAYQQAAKKVVPSISKKALDNTGILATHLNAQLIHSMFEKYADNKLIFSKPKKISTKKRIIIAAGWDPGASTDYNAVYLAKMLKAKAVINLTNVDYVYNKNPKKYKNAKPIKELTWKQFKKIVGGKWTPGANLPFDPIASKLAEKNKLKVFIINGGNLTNVKSALHGKSFKGTVIQG